MKLTIFLFLPPTVTHGQLLTLIGRLAAKRASGTAGGEDVAHPYTRPGSDLFGLELVLLPDRNLAFALYPDPSYPSSFESQPALAAAAAAAGLRQATKHANRGRILIPLDDSPSVRGRPLDSRVQVECVCLLPLEPQLDVMLDEVAHQLTVPVMTQVAFDSELRPFPSLFPSRTAVSWRRVNCTSAVANISARHRAMRSSHIAAPGAAAGHCQAHGEAAGPGAPR